MTTCSCCGGNSFESYPYNNHLGMEMIEHDHNIPHNERIFSSNYPINVCSACGYGYYTKRLEAAQLSHYYREEYSNWNLEHIKTNADSDERSVGQFGFVEEYVPFYKVNKMLEIGAGAALPSRYIKSQFPGVSTFVVEPNPNFRDYYEQNCLLHISPSFPFEETIPLRFEYVHASHWLEHALNLHSTVEALNGVVSMGGYLFLEVPNCTGQYYQNDIKDTPHLHFFTAESLERLFAKIGFSLLKKGTYWLTFREYWLFRQGKLGTDVKSRASKQSAQNVPTKDGAWLRLLFKKNSDET